MNRLRRDLVAGGSGALLAALLGAPAASQVAAARDQNPFQARSPAAVYAALGLAAPAATTAIVITAPDIAENGANVRVEVEAKLPDVTRILLVAERNIFPLLADARISSRALPWIEAKIRLAETSNLRAVVEAGGRLYTATRHIKVIVGGCLPG